MLPFLGDKFGNPSALHSGGHFARQAIAEAREKAAAFINAGSADSIIFTGNGTEAVNLAVKGAWFASQHRGKHVVTSAIEHPATLKSLEFLESFGCLVTKVPVNPEGLIDADAIREAIRPDTVLICIHHANHDLGTIQPVAKIGEMAAERRIMLFVDAIASAGWVEIDVENWNASLVSISPHRFYGPKGVGILYRDRRTRLTPLIHGGEQEEKRRAGTENVAAIVGAGVACEAAREEVAARADHARSLQEFTWAAIRSQIKHLRLFGPCPGPLRHPANLNFSVEFVEGEGLALALDVKGFAIGSGAACVTRSMRVPPVLAAIGVDESLARGNVLVSFGMENTRSDIEKFTSAFAAVVEMMREMSPLWDDFQRGVLAAKTAE